MTAYGCPLGQPRAHVPPEEHQPIRDPRCELPGDVSPKVNAGKIGASSRPSERCRPGAFTSGLVK